MLKVLKFGGSSMADAHQLEKVRSIVEADPARRVVVVSAAGKRFKDDHKITDLLYLCHAHLQYGVSCDGIFDMVRSRYLEIRDELGLSTPGGGIRRPARQDGQGHLRRRAGEPGRVFRRPDHGRLPGL